MIYTKNEYIAIKEVGFFLSANREYNTFKSQPNGDNRVIYVNDFESGYLARALPKRRPMLLPFYIHGCLISIRYKK